VTPHKKLLRRLVKKRISILKDTTPNKYIKLIDYELSKISSSSKSPGWTPWALGLSFSAVIWKAIESYLDNPAETVFWHFLLLFIFFRTFALIARDILDISAITDSNPLLTHELNSKTDYPSKSILNSATDLIPIACISLSPLSYQQWFYWTVIITYSFIFFTKSIKILDLYKSKNHYISEHSASPKLIYLALFAEAVLLVLVSLFAYQWWLASPPLLPFDQHEGSIKLALFAFAFIILSGLIQTRHQEPKLPKELHRIRQKLLFGTATDSDLNNLRLLTLGISSDEYLQQMKSNYDTLDQSASLALSELDSWLLQLEGWNDDSILNKPLEFTNALKKGNSKQLSALSVVLKYHEEFKASVKVVRDLVVGGLDKEVSKQYLKSTQSSIKSQVTALGMMRARIDKLYSKLKRIAD